MNAASHECPNGQGGREVEVYLFHASILGGDLTLVKFGVLANGGGFVWGRI